MMMHAPTSEIAAQEWLREWLNDRCGIFFPESKHVLLAHRLKEVAERFQLSGLRDLVRQIESGEHQDVQMAVVHAASTNHTYFFREMRVLDFFSNSILPTLDQRESVHIWCAAVSTGDEAFTVAILCGERWGLKRAYERVSILGTDISKPVIQRAESAFYSDTHLEHMPPLLRARYFRPYGDDNFIISNSIRALCTFRRLNLKAEPYPFQNKFDVILCRNVLYYFDRRMQFRVLEAMYDVCAPGGWLLTSVTEAIRDLGSRWTQIDSGIYRKL